MQVSGAKEDPMTRIAIATFQAGWDCHWARPDDAHAPNRPLAGDVTTVVCNRQGAPQRVSSVQCEACPHWELACDAFQTATPAESR